MSESTSIIERIKHKLDIVDEIGAVVPLKKSGKAFKGLCPFHSERTPSFYVFPETGTWKCFGCGENGDVFSFVEKQQGLDFREVLALLAERAGVPLDRSPHAADGTVAESPETAARRRLRALNEAAAIWFHHQLLQSPEAQYCRRYLESRGVNAESIATWRLGFAPDGGQLTTYLQEQGYSAREIVDAGLGREREAERGGGLYDAFRNRLIFPIRDIRGQTIAFGGRELGGGQPKYLNTPQTPLFDKSATLYGLDLAREAIRRANQVVIVEGYMDAVVTHQHGFRTVVACIGSAITEKHVRQIKKLTRRVALALDPDAAGDAATLRGIVVAQQAFDHKMVPIPDAAPGPKTGTIHGRGLVRFQQQVDAEITIVRLPPGLDPDEFVRRDPAGWQRAVAEALPLVDYLFEAQTADLKLDTPAGKTEAARRLLPTIAELGIQAEQDAYVRRLAKLLRVEEFELTRDMRRVRSQMAREARRVSTRNSSDGLAEPETNGAASGEAATGALGKEYPADAETPQPGFAAGYSAPGTSNALSPLGVAARILAEQAQEEFCLGLLLERPAVWPEMQPILLETDFAGTEMRELFRACVGVLRSGAPLEAQRIIEGLPPVLQAAAEHARARLAPGVPEEGTALVKMASNAAYRLKRTRLREEMAELDYLQRDAEQMGDGDALRALLGRKQHLLAQRRAIDAAAGLYG